MATSSRDVTLTLAVDTLGTDGITQLQSKFAALAQEGGAAAPEFQKLADQISRLGEQNAALTSFKELEEVTSKLRAGQEAAAASVSDLAVKLTTLKEAAGQAAINQKEAAAQVVAGAKAYNDAGVAIKLLKADFDSAGKQTQEFKDRLGILLTTQNDIKNSNIDLQASLRAATTESSQAASAADKLATQYNRQVIAASKSAEVLQVQERALASAASASQALGVSVEEVAAAEAQLVSIFNKGVTAVQQNAAAVKNLSDEQQTLTAGLTQNLTAVEELLSQQQAAATSAKVLTAAERALTAEFEAQTQAVSKLLAQEEAAATAKQLATAQALLTTELELQAAAATRATAADAELAQEQAAGAEASAKALAVAQGLLTTEFELQAIAAGKLIAAEQALAEAQAAASAKVEAASKAAAAAAQAAAGQINNAFKTVGVRSAQELEAEILQVRTAMDTLRASSANTGTALSGAFTAGEAKVASLERELRALNGTLTAGDKAASLFANSMGQFAAGNLIAAGVGAIINKITELGRAFLDVVVKSDQLSRGLNAVYKDSAVAATQIDFLRRTSQESGVAFSGLSGEFVKFSASMRAANIPLSQSNELFKAMTAAAASLGLSAEDVGGTLNALGQIASKGVVQMEELRGQLGDRLPGALGLTSKAMGITEAQLVALVASGNLAARDFFGPFTQGLKTMQGDVEGLVPTFERLKGALQGFAAASAEAGGIQVLTGIVKAFGVVIGGLGFSLSIVGEITFGIARAFAALALSLTSPKEAMHLLTDTVDAATKRLTAQAVALQTMVLPAENVAVATNKVSTAMTANTAATVKQINANKDLDAGQKLAALSAALQADATLDASAKLIQYNVAAEALLKLQEVQIEAYAKLAKAAKEEGDILVSVAKISGDASAIARASAEASTLHAVALERVAKAHQVELAILVGEKAELLANSSARGLNAEQIKIQTDALDAKIKKSEAEVEQSKQLALAAQQEAAARKLALETLGDQSARIGEYTKQLVQLQTILKEYERLQVEGLKTEQEVQAIREQIATTTAKLRDAQTDLNTKLQQETAYRRDSLKLNQDILQGEIALATALADQARSIGDNAKAVTYEIEIKKKRYEIDKLGLEIKKVEIELEKAELQAKLALLAIEEPDNTLKRQKLELETKLNDLKGKSIDSSKKLLEVQRQQTAKDVESLTTFGKVKSAMQAQNDTRQTGLQLLGQESTARGVLEQKIVDETTALEKQNAEQEHNNAVKEKAIELENKRLNIDKEGFTLNTKGDRVVGQVDNQRSVFENAKNQGLTDAQALQIADRFFKNGQQTGGEQANTSLGENWGTELQKAINDLVLQNARSRALDDKKAAAPGAPPVSVQPVEVPAKQGATGQSTPAGAAVTNNVTIHLSPGVDVSSRAGVEQLARAIMPAINNLNRRGANVSGA